MFLKQTSVRQTLQADSQTFLKELTLCLSVAFVTKPVSAFNRQGPVYYNSKTLNLQTINDR